MTTSSLQNLNIVQVDSYSDETIVWISGVPQDKIQELLLRVSENSKALQGGTIKAESIEVNGSTIEDVAFYQITPLPCNSLAAPLNIPDKSLESPSLT